MSAGLPCPLRGAHHAHTGRGWCGARLCVLCPARALLHMHTHSEQSPRSVHTPVEPGQACLAHGAKSPLSQERQHAPTTKLWIACGFIYCTHAHTHTRTGTHIRAQTHAYMCAYVRTSAWAQVKKRLRSASETTIVVAWRHVVAQSRQFLRCAQRFRKRSLFETMEAWKCGRLKSRQIKAKMRVAGSRLVHGLLMQVRA